jgi:hypothetical protein
MMEKQINLPNNLDILDSKLFNMSISVIDYNLKIELLLELKPDNLYLKMAFEEVMEYSFYWNSTYTFYIIDSYKLFANNNIIYISLDPDDCEEFRSVNDQDYILSNSMKLYISKDKNFKCEKEVSFN